jgi:hypothetical protein
MLAALKRLMGFFFLHSIPLSHLFVFHEGSTTPSFLSFFFFNSTGAGVHVPTDLYGIMVVTEVVYWMSSFAACSGLGSPNDPIKFRTREISSWSHVTTWFVDPSKKRVVNLARVVIAAIS